MAWQQHAGMLFLCSALGVGRWHVQRRSTNLEDAPVTLDWLNQSCKSPVGHARIVGGTFCIIRLRCSLDVNTSAAAALGKHTSLLACIGDVFLLACLVPGCLCAMRTGWCICLLHQCVTALANRGLLL